MANIKISQLPTASVLTSDDFLPIVENTATQTQRADLSTVLSYVTSSTFNTLTVTSLTASVSGTFVGDGSGITGVTGEWDGTHTGDAEITGTLSIKNGHVNLTENAYFFQGSSTGGSNVSLVGVNSSNQVVIGNAGYQNILDDDTYVSGNLEVSGAVGIGTTSPNAKLEVVGDSIFSGSVEVSGTLRADVEVSGNITAASYTLSAVDYGKTLLFSSSATQDITCSSGLDVGYNVTVIQAGTGQLNFSGSGVTLVNRFAHTSSAGQYSAVSVIVLNGTQYLVVGDTA